MRIILNIWMFVFIISLIFSCSNESNTPKESETKFDDCVVYFDWDSTFNFHLVSQEKINQIGKGSACFKMNYDYNDHWFYNYYFLPKGNYLYSIRSFFGQQMTIEFSINSDTLIYIPNKFHYKNVDFLSEQVLLNRDTIQLLYKSDGCFHHNYEKWILVKDSQNQQYKITIHYSEYLDHNYCLFPPFVSDEMIKDLTNIQLESIKLKKMADLSELKCISTTTQRLFLFVDDKIFSFSDMYIHEWNLFDQLKNKYSIK